MPLPKKVNTTALKVVLKVIKLLKVAVIVDVAVKKQATGYGEMGKWG
jgi:hypothetical protein